MENSRKEEIGKKIKDLRIKFSLTQEELAEKLEIKHQTIYKYENGIIKNIKYETIEKLSKIFNVTPQYLLGLDDDDTSIPSKEELRQRVAAFYQNKKISDESKDEFFKEIQEIFFQERLKKEK